MKIDKLFSIGLALITGAIIWFLEFIEIISPSKGSKFYCVEFECLFLGIVFLIIGLSILGYKVYKWQAEKKE
jgi:Na+/H+ antiporter NhaD/arsenite permease-like protein